VSSLVDSTRTVLEHAMEVYRGSPAAGRLAQAHERLDAPLRVAIAGRVKSGKSTLLNALVGERLAPTDAGECTRIVTWYQDGHTYRVDMHPRGKRPRQARFTRDDGVLEIDLAGADPETIDQLTVTWPSRTLRRATLIDTPGIGSLSESLSRRTWDLLMLEDEEESPADAVLYLMKHLHAGDVDFLRAFQDTEVSRPNPINAIGVLSRADEIAVGRLDAMTSARRIAERLSGEPRLRRVAQTVMPVAGLLAETAATLTETEVGQLRRIAKLTPDEVDGLLLSADRFLGSRPELGITEIERARLLERFGVFGVRLSSTLLRRGVAGTASDLARELLERSGLIDLQAVLNSLFFERREVLKSRSALLAVNALVQADPRTGSDRVASDVEQIIASAHPFNELRVLSAVRAGQITGKPEVLTELEQLIGGSGTAVHLRLGLPPDAAPAQLRATAFDALARWQRRAENPITGYELAVASRIVVRSCEGILAEVPMA
jgi:GTPase SAR1 family protein